MNPVLDIFLRWVIPFICAGIASTCAAYIGGIRKKKKDEDAKYNEEHELLKAGMRALLRSDIISMNEKYMTKGYCPVYARDTLVKAYNAYHGLDGDDVATALYNEVMELPTHPSKKGVNQDEESNKQTVD